MEKLYQQLDHLYDEMVEVFRHLHMNPELSFEEVETPKFIADYHTQLGHEVRTEVGGRGVVAKLKGGKPGPTIALRADFDALPIQEETDLPHKSKVDGVMHACGHDGHTAELLILAKALNKMKEELQGTIVFIHQHAEEYQPGGAIAMIEDGCLEGVDVIFGTHLWANAHVGEIGFRSGPVMAAADRFHITIQGKGGHGAQPHLTKDSVVIASQVVTNLQQIVARRVDPLESAVVSIGNFVAKNAFNVIADSVELTGTVRTFKEDVRSSVETEIERVVKGACLSADAEYKYQFVKGYPACVNHQEETEFLAETAASVPGVKNVYEAAPQMGGEDFSYYLQHVKGTFFFTGAGDPDWKETYPHHHPKFKISEQSMLVAAKTLGKAVVEYAKKESPVLVEQ
ncbi:amidohydrolase [Rossellomorea vietnamensis]|uniref:Amidohydrolase n=1 Tax=Rossellomorea vietnamensis TaxID=218284 RepID=A0A5D4K7R7_9BACI|nr:M20 family metallopeptidase [Rossellomorea vietnamensis]TYR73447.1 amidohydrolase [Rossellomorea vietnamensis]